jgi:hypothetical protein
MLIKSLNGRKQAKLQSPYNMNGGNWKNVRSEMSQNLEAEHEISGRQNY